MASRGGGRNTIKDARVPYVGNPEITRSSNPLQPMRKMTSCRSNKYLTSSLPLRPLRLTLKLLQESPRLV
jgi:hypothetical protein